jgi:hypothetical protein
MDRKTTYLLTDAQKAQRLTEIRTLLKDFLKVIKVVTMYPEDNPLPQGMRRSLAERLAEHIEEYGQIRILAGRDTLTCDGETVFIDRTKEEALAGLFFETGITTITFMESFDIEGAYKLLDAIKRYMNTPGRTLDLANLLWESGIGRFSFTTLEDIALAEYKGDFNVREIGDPERVGSSGPVLFGTDQIESYQAIFATSSEDSDSGMNRKDGDDSQPVPLRGGRRSSGANSRQAFFAVNAEPAGSNFVADLGLDGVSFKAAEAAEAMGLTDLPGPVAPRANTVLILNDEFRLSEEDERAISDIAARDAEFDLWESSLELCKELLHQESELSDFTETIGICSKIGTEFLAAGRLWHCGQLIQYMSVLELQIRSQRPAWADKLKDAVATFGSRERMDLLGETLNLHPETGADELRRYLGCFNWEALGAITNLLGELIHETHREVVCDHLTVTGRTHLQIIAKGIYDKRPEAVRGAIIVLTRIGDPQAFGVLKKAAENSDRDVRLELVTQLKDCPGGDALSILRLAVSDKDGEIRRTAIASIAAQRDEAAFATVREIISEPSFALMADSDKQQILNAYSTLGGESAILILSTLARRFNPFRNPILASQRRCAFEALCHNPSDVAERLLIQLCRSWRPDIRQQAKTALNRRRQVLFGGNNE